MATPAAAVGTPCPDFTLTDVEGVQRRRDDVVTGKAALVVFFCNHCPYAQAVEDRLIALHLELAPRGLSTTLIASNDWEAYPDDAPEKLRARALAKKYPFPYLVDETQRVARAFDAACTPDFFLFDSGKKLVYRGRLDDNWKRAELVKQRELAAAIDAVITGKPVSSVQHPSLGCSIKWKVDA
ncbi:MAG: thioredoxin family protein [Deltaproteobacteria bacterium]|nr:thioredoxin family protein [Deltaproteobacteria bacterium]